ncbi:MAG: phosphate-starvation-inducible PsiE family protein [Gammaproteobacteria bacterium]|nr:phosphate-starvation-inducible PsiE family protein [Gammaproteobacteria bacterium]
MNRVRTISHRAIGIIEDLGLIIIAIATVIAVGFEIMHMVRLQEVTLADLLLLFIYLEVLAMVGVYLESGKLPIRMPLYIAIVALARYLILDVKNMDTLRMVGVAGATLLIAVTVLAIRYGHTRYPYGGSDEK